MGSNPTLHVQEIGIEISAILQYEDEIVHVKRICAK